MRGYTTTLLFCIFQFFITPISGAIIYVDTDATGADDGTSWSDAYEDLYTAVGSSSAGDEIWVADGLYFTPGFVTSFTIIDHSLKIYGGFDGTETARWQRDWETNPAVISANVGSIFDMTDNDDTFFTIEIPSGVDEVIIDGFTFRDAYSTFHTFSISNNGVYNEDLEVQIRHCKFIANQIGCIAMGAGEYGCCISTHDFKGFSDL